MAATPARTSDTSSIPPGRRTYVLDTSVLLSDPHAMMRRELGFFDIVGAKNPRVKMVLINEAGHFPYREHPEQFNAHLVNFIDFWSTHQ